jgi:hypothetical protein
MNERLLEVVIVKVKLYLCLINETTHYKDIWGSEGIDPPIQLQKPASLTLGELPPVPLNMKQGGSQSRPGRHGEETYIGPARN